MGEPGESVAARAIRALGTGFDLTYDFRLTFAKSSGDGRRLVELDERSVRDVHIPGGGTVPAVPRGISCDKGDRIRFRSDILEFNQI